MVTNWLITGGCGFIGTSLVARILKETPEANIRIYDNLSAGTERDLSGVCTFKKLDADADLPEPSGVELVVGDIRDSDRVSRIMRGVQAVVHLAANTGVGPSVENPRIDMETNIVGLFNVLDGARLKGVSRFIFASSGAPAGEVEPPIHEEIAPKPVSPYGASKLAGEGYCSAYGRTFGLKTVALRFGNVYGPGSVHKASVVAKFIKTAMEGKECEIYGNGRQTRDFIYIDDLIDAILSAVKSEEGGEVFQIASSMERTVNEVAEMIREELRNRGIEMKIRHGEVRKGDVMRNYSDTSKAKRVLGWESRVPLEEGIRKTVEYFIEIYKS